MTLNQADKIVREWGKFIQDINFKLMLVFGSSVPESLLPYPKATILEASNIMAKHYHDKGNIEHSNRIKSVAIELVAYIDDEQALKNSAQYYLDKKWLKVIIPALKKMQKKS